MYYLSYSNAQHPHSHHHPHPQASFQPPPTSATGQSQEAQPPYWQPAPYAFLPVPVFDPSLPYSHQSHPHLPSHSPIPSAPPRSAASSTSRLEAQGTHWGGEALPSATGDTFDHSLPAPQPQPVDESGEDATTEAVDVVPVDPTLLHQGEQPTPKPPMLARSRRAAASKARTTISAATGSLRALPLADRTNGCDNQQLSSTESSPTDPSKVIESVNGKSTGRPNGSKNRNPHSKAQNLLIGPPPAITPPSITLKNARGPLLPCPPGSQLEVNDLLIMHPPALSPSVPRQPVNQYSQAPAPEGYKSQFEMYTCRVCSKTYDGKNARSVARRHLQDKHGVPLAMQQRRTRWDGEPDRPRSAGAAREKTLKSKRDWAQKTRHIQRLERIHAVFLAPFGPEGILAPCGTRLIAPNMRNSSASTRNKEYPRGWLSWDEIPVGLRQSLQNPQGGGGEGTDENTEGEEALLPGRGPTRGSNAKNAKAKTHTRNGKKRDLGSMSTINTSTSMSTSTSNFSFDSGDSPPGQQLYGTANTQTRTPVSSARTHLEHSDLDSSQDFHLGMLQVDDEENAGYQGWDGQYGSATHVSDTALQAALAQHYGFTYPALSMSQDDAAEYQFEPREYEALASAIEAPLDMDQVMDSAPLSPEEEGLYAVEEEPERVFGPSWMEHSQLWLSQSVAGDEREAQGNQKWEQDETMEVLDNVPGAIKEEPEGDAQAEELEQTESEHESETRAAESLLNLHSTPARPEDLLRPPVESDEDDQAKSTIRPLTSDSLLPSSTVGNTSGLLDPPEITPRPRTQRAKSFIQPFAKSRPEAPSRSLSFVDDPFVLSPLPPSSGKPRKRRSTIASPSPLQVKRRREQQDGTSPRVPLSVLRSSAHLNRSSNGGNPSSVVKNGNGNGHPGSSGFQDKEGSLTLSAKFETPVRPGRNAVPSSLSKMWLLSSPATDAAASLGLVPGWGIAGTPGVSGMVGAETPWRGKGVAAKLARDTGDRDKE